MVEQSSKSAIKSALKKSGDAKMKKNVSLCIDVDENEDSKTEQTIVVNPISEETQSKKSKLKITVDAPKEEAKAQGGSKKMTPEEKKAQREAANKAKAAKKEMAAQKKAAQAAAEAEGAEVSNPAQEKKATDKAQKKQQSSAAPQHQPSSAAKPAKPVTQFSKFDPVSGSSGKTFDISAYQGTDIHPKILELVLNLQSNVLEHSNQICIATLFALREFLNDYQIEGMSAEAPSPGNRSQPNNENVVLDRPTLLQLQEKWISLTSFIRDGKRLHEGVLNALEEADRLMQESVEDMSLRQIKTTMSNWFDNFIENKIVFAQDEMIRLGIDLLSKKRDETVMVIGINYVLERLFVQAHEQGYNLTVIVVDTCPSFSGRNLVKRLSARGVKCIYTLIQGISALVTRTTKLFIGASYVLGNGGCVSQMGTSMVAYLASQHKVPVIAFCETYKFTQRVNLDQIKNNELGNPREMTHNYLLPDDWTQKQRDNMLTQRNLRVHNLRYDLTNMSCINMILCEIGRVAPVSVSVVVDEFNAEAAAEAERLETRRAEQGF